MVSQKQINASKRNAQRSTGPRTATGKAVIATNAIKTGCYATRHLVLPLLGEREEEHQAYTADAISALDPVGPVEEQLAATIASLLWRLRRVPVFEAAASCPPADALTEDPNLVEPQSGFTPGPPPSTAPLADRLASIRLALKTTRKMCDDHIEARTRLKTRSSKDDECDCDQVHALTTAANVVLDRLRLDWTAMAVKVGIEVPPEMCPLWTYSLLWKAFDLLAEETGQMSAAFRKAVSTRLKTKIGELNDHLEQLRTKENTLVEQMQSKRLRAAAVTVYDTERAVAGIQRAEQHLTRQLERSFAMLERMQSRRKAPQAQVLNRFDPRFDPPRLAGPGHDRAALGFVFHSGSLSEEDGEELPVFRPAPTSEAVPLPLSPEVESEVERDERQAL